MIICIVLLGFFGTLAVQVPQIPAVSKGYPMVLLIVSVLMTVGLLIKSVLNLKNEEKQETKVVEQLKIIVPYTVMIVAYLILMKLIGYIAATVVFMISSLVYLKLKNKIVMIVLPLVMTVILYFVFTNYLTVILPKGSLFNIAF